MEHLNKLPFTAVEICGGFWANRQKINRETTIWAVKDRFEDTGRFAALDFKPVPGLHFFWDSDLAKWLESAADIIAKGPDEALQAEIDDMVDKIEAHQDANGYYNIFHTVIEPDNRFKNRDHHELYCLGHLIEAAVSIFQATGSDRLIRILDRYIDYVIERFCEKADTGFKTPGHEEIELALYKLYAVKPEEKYRRLAKFFLDHRHEDRVPENFWCGDTYFQSHQPVREQRIAVGHSVRANYLYSGMADEARVENDEEMLAACRALFDDMYYKKMYVTGGIGSSHIGEAFTVPYDLPNDTAYAETCASIAFAMFANRMKDLELNSKYADLVETEMYNGVLSGVSLNGKSFFYENPLEINLEDRTRHGDTKNSERLPITERLEVFGCSCCPPNLTRFIASIGEYMYSYDENRIVLHQYIDSEAVVDGALITLETAYPANGTVHLNVAGGKGKTLLLRIPGWCEHFTLNAPYVMQNGYAAVELKEEVTELTLELEMKVRFLAARREVRHDAGRVAVAWGPLVYCAEKKDNDELLWDLSLDTHSEPVVVYADYFGAPEISLKAKVRESFDLKALYLPLRDVKYTTVPVRLIPYYAFANRGSSDMRVWFRYI